MALFSGYEIKGEYGNAECPLRVLFARHAEHIGHKEYQATVDDRVQNIERSVPAHMVRTADQMLGMNGKAKERLYLGGAVTEDDMKLFEQAREELRTIVHGMPTAKMASLKQ